MAGLFAESSKAPPLVPPLISAAADPGRARAEQASKASWLAPIIAVALNAAANASGAGESVGRAGLLTVGVASFLIYLSGLSAGIFA